RLVQPLLDDGREPNAVNDRRVVQLVGNDDVAWLTERREDRLVRIPARGEGVRALHAVELGDRPLDRLVRLEGTADEAHARVAGAVSPQSPDPRLNDLGVIGETEVVVGAETGDVAILTE